jgi:hypothetical protein
VADRPSDPARRLQQAMEALNRIGGESAGVDVLMQRICDEIMQVCDASGAVVERADGSEMVYVCAAGSVAAHVGLRLPMAGSLSGLCVASRATQRCVDSENDPRVHREACRKVRARSMLLVPLLYGGEAIGVLKATSERLFAFGPDDEQLLRCCAGIIGAALGRELALEAERRHSAELAQALDASRADAERLGRDALCDALTGLPNRRRFDQEIDRLLDGERLAGGAALAFVDLNDFKSINDRYGHEAGDAALRAVADALRATLRVGDLAARLAGARRRTRRLAGRPRRRPGRALPLVRPQATAGGGAIAGAGSWPTHRGEHQHRPRPARPPRPRPQHLAGPRRRRHVPRQARRPALLLPARRQRRTGSRLNRSLSELPARQRTSISEQSAMHSSLGGMASVRSW